MDQQRQHQIKTAAIDRGYRQTAQRAMVLAEVKTAEGHPTAGEIFERVRRKDPKVAYRLMPELTFADEAGRIGGRTDHHDHGHCTTRGLLVDVPITPIARHVTEERSGFAISCHHTVLVGDLRDATTACRLSRRAAKRRAVASKRLAPMLGALRGTGC